MNKQRFQKLIKLGKNHKNWYGDGYEQIKRICDKEGWSVDEFIDILAITSPRVKVKRNIRITLHYMKERELPSGVMQNIHKSLENYKKTNTIGGPKTKAFANAIKGDEDEVVLDVWMARAFKVEQKVFKRKKYTEYAEKFRKFAKSVDEKPRDCQAMVWAGVICEAGLNPSGLSIEKEYEAWKN